jgi:hypothetical protein
MLCAFFVAGKRQQFAFADYFNFYKLPDRKGEKVLLTFSRRCPLTGRIVRGGARIVFTNR